VWLARPGRLKKSDDLIDNQTRDFSACSIVPQPTAELRLKLNTYCLFCAGDLWVR
jgi:hypothetical protein